MVKSGHSAHSLARPRLCVRQKKTNGLPYISGVHIAVYKMLGCKKGRSRLYDEMINDENLWMVFLHSSSVSGFTM